WDMRNPGPEKIDASLVTRRNKPLTHEPDPRPGPVAVPGEYSVELAVGPSTHRATLRIVKDPRLSTPLEAHQRQFDLLHELSQALSRVNGSVNRIRRLARQLGALAEAAREPHA